MTNLEKIQSLDVCAMADFLVAAMEVEGYICDLVAVGNCDGGCADCIRGWLGEEAIPEQWEEQKAALKPCPFCGCEAKVKEYEVMDADGDERNAWGIACSNHKCIAFGTDLVPFLSPEKAIDAWNRRTK